MHKDLIVAIFAATGAGDDPDGCFGTGYPVTEDLILTSCHVVAPVNSDLSVQIEVKWFYDQSAGHWISIEPADLVWTGSGDLDAALIRCRRPEYLRRFPVGQVVERRPVDGERWQSAGFARANKRGDVREPGQFGGILRTMAEVAPFFEIIEDAKPIAEEQWKGVSGMPVFAGSAILGVVKHVSPNYDHQKLEAVPLWRLLQDEGFRKALGLDDRDERLTPARKLLERLLAGSDAVTCDFAVALGLEASRSEIGQCRQQVSEQLLAKTPERLCELALTVQAQRRDAKDRTGARVAADVTLAILPAIHDAAVVAHVRQYRGDSQIPCVLLPTKLTTLAEIIMAATDRRAAKLRSPATPRQFPEGESSLPEPPESGRDADGKQFADDWRNHLLQTFDADLPRFKASFQTYLKQRFLQSDLRSLEAGIAEQELLDAVREQLRQEAEAPAGGLTYYFIVRMPQDPKARADREAVLAELKKTFPPIAFLRLDGGEPLSAEISRYGRLRDLLYEAPESKP